MNRETWTLFCPAWGFLASLQHSLESHCSIPEESIVALNDEWTDCGAEVAPLDVSHLLRASVWFAEIVEGTRSPGVRLSFFERWCLSARELRHLCVTRVWAKSAQRAFADNEANEDALQLFKLATAGCATEPEAERYTSLIKRLLAIQCTLPNPAVSKYVRKNGVKLLAEMRDLRDSITGEVEQTKLAFVQLRWFIAWLEATTLLSKSLLDESRELQFFNRLEKNVRKADLQKLPAADVFLFFHTLDVSPLSRKSSFQPTAKEKRPQNPVPCSICGLCIASFMYCATCKLVVYCGKECQRKDWKRKPVGHKERCALLKKNVTDILLAV
uniref:MYND-type domain-containing protein n=1 Tax=Chromera velia CCMP2878 TaxID=1169474 RepID=A0A0G4I5R9_9ALVE|eukprot:Cvel_61.t1-p1 / transcript=Cvel_61.t1 / gene=Cvel_61 / organism=Chromera_velia_CCMP2878 / gene_product=hypothetical protein / transcript_product=hypothetical protein / location=Cvel_scaffold6:59231-60211(-) / protein_length=327 / sequence_SO=supercontig / SO=protein_coding / is_pseudo=false